MSEFGIYPVLLIILGDAINPPIPTPHGVLFLVSCHSLWFLSVNITPRAPAEESYSQSWDCPHVPLMWFLYISLCLSLHILGLLSLDLTSAPSVISIVLVTQSGPSLRCAPLDPTVPQCVKESSSSSQSAPPREAFCMALKSSPLDTPPQNTS